MFPGLQHSRRSIRAGRRFFIPRADPTGLSSRCPIAQIRIAKASSASRRIALIDAIPSAGTGSSTTARTTRNGVPPVLANCVITRSTGKGATGPVSFPVSATIVLPSTVSPDTTRRAAAGLTDTSCISTSVFRRSAVSDTRSCAASVMRYTRSPYAVCAIHPGETLSLTACRTGCVRSGPQRTGHFPVISTNCQHITPPGKRAMRFDQIDLQPPRRRLHRSNRSQRHPETAGPGTRMHRWTPAIRPIPVGKGAAPIECLQKPVRISGQRFAVESSAIDADHSTDIRR